MQTQSPGHRVTGQELYQDGSKLREHQEEPSALPERPKRCSERGKRADIERFGEYGKGGGLLEQKRDNMADVHRPSAPCAQSPGCDKARLKRSWIRLQRRCLGPKGIKS